MREKKKCLAALLAVSLFMGNMSAAVSAMEIHAEETVSTNEIVCADEEEAQIVVSEDAVLEESVSEENAGVVTPADGGEIKEAVTMADTYYYIDNGENEYEDEDYVKYTLPFYFEINDEDLPQSVSVNNLTVKVDGEPYECEQRSKDGTWRGFEVYDLGQKITAGETIHCDVQLFCGEQLVYEKNGVTFQESCIEHIQTYTVTPYTKRIPFSILTAVESDEYHVTLTDETGKGIIRKTIAYGDMEHGGSLWSLFYKDIFTNGSQYDYDEIFGEQRGVMLEGYITLRAPLIKGRNYGIKCSSIEEDKPEVLLMEQPNIYSVQNGGEILDVQANIIETDSSILYLNFYGKNLDSERIQTVLTDISGNQIGEVISKSIKPLSDWEMQQFHYLQEDEYSLEGLQRLSCRIRINEAAYPKKLFYEILTSGDYICITPSDRRLTIYRYATTEEYLQESENYINVGTEVWLNRYPNQIGMELCESIADETTIRANLYEDQNTSQVIASAQGKVSDNTVYLEFMKNPLDQYVFSNSHSYTIEYTADVAGNIISAQKDFTLEEAAGNIWQLEKGCESFYSADGEYLPVVFYYLNEKYDTCVNMTCGLRQDNTDIADTDVSCQGEQVTYHGMKALRFTAQIPAGKMQHYGKYTLHIRGRIKGAPDLDKAVNECPLSITYQKEVPYRVVSYSYDTSGRDYVTTFVMNWYITEEAKNQMCAYLSGEEAVRMEAQGKKLIVTHSGTLTKNLMVRYLYLGYAQSDILPAAPCDDYDAENKVYRIYLNEKKAGFLTAEDAVRGQSIISGTYAHNLEYPMTVDVKKIYSGESSRTFSVTSSGDFSEELFSATDPNQVYEISLRDQTGYILANATGLIGKPEKVILSRLLAIKDIMRGIENLPMI